MGIYREGRRLATIDVARYVLAALVMEGRTKVVISREMIEDELAQALEIRISTDNNTRSTTVHLSLKGFKSQVAEADYEIIEESSALPQPPKQLPSETPHK